MKKDLGPRLLALVGATSSGKSALATRAARALGGEIVNCDALQVYRFLELGTAKPSSAERARLPHHLYDLIDPDQTFSAGRYMLEARRICRQIAERGRLPIVVGGTGLYLRALLEGIFEGPAGQERLRRRLWRIARRSGPERLHALLRRRDPEAARRIQPRDVRRLVRALEVWLLTGEPISRLQAHRRPLKGFKILKVGLRLERELLYGRIERRVEEMFRRGLLDEVRGLLEQGWQPECKAFEALGYRHALECLEGHLEEREAVERTCRDTRRYAKRQMTWFRREEDIHWIEGPGESETSFQQLMALVRSVWPALPA